MSTKKECLEKIDEAIQKRLALWKWPGGHVTPESQMELAAFLKEAGFRALEKIGTSLCRVCGKKPSCLNTQVATAEIKGAWCIVPSRIHMLRYKHCSHVHMAINNKGNQVAKANAVAVEAAKAEAFQQQQRQILEAKAAVEAAKREAFQLQAAAETEKAKAAAEIAELRVQLAKKDTQLEAEIAELRVQLAKKDTQLEAEVLNINKETEAHRLKLEEAKKTNTTKWASCFGCP